MIKLQDKLVKKVNKCIYRIALFDEALDELYAITKESMWFVARKYLVDKSKIDDVLNEAYLNIYRKASSFDSSQNGINWMYSIVKNAALNQNRTDKRFDSEEFPEETDLTTDDNLEQNLVIRLLIEEALKILSDKEKEIIELSFWEQKTLKEIAQHLNMPISSVHYAYKNALKKIKNWWLKL